MHRTQVLLKERQYAALKSLARREGKGLGELVRLAVDRLLGTADQEGRMRLKALCGIGRDPGGPCGREHDRLLCGSR